MSRAFQEQPAVTPARARPGNHKGTALPGAETDPDQRILVEVWTDFICPWCGIGEIRFAQALERFEHRDRVDLVRHSFRLMPGDAPRPVEELMADKYELLPEEIGASLHNLEQTAAAVGLTYRLAGSIAGDTMDAHRLLHLAREAGLEGRFHARVFKAAMCEGVSIYDHKSLLELAASCGLNRESALAVISGNRFRDEVEAEESVMKGYGGHSVPFFVFNSSRHYTGALSPDIFLNALEKTRQAAEAEEAAAPPEGAVCGPDGCALPS